MRRIMSSPRDAGSVRAGSLETLKATSMFAERPPRMTTKRGRNAPSVLTRGNS